MTFSLKKASALVLSLSLMGCANLSPLPKDANPVDHLTRAYERSFTVDNRYNFEVESKLTSFASADDDQAQINDSARDIDIHLEDADDVANVDALIKSEQDDDDYYGSSAYEKRLKQKQINLFNTMKHFSMVAKGAVDMPNGRMEVTPSIQYYGNNIEAKASLPMALNLSKGEILADPSAITSTFGWALGLDRYGIDAANGRFLRYKFDKDVLKDLPVNDLAKAYLDAIKKSLSELSPEQLKFSSIDAQGKKMGASRQISLTQTLPELMTFSASTLTHFKANVDEFLETYEGKPLPPMLLAFFENLDDMPELMMLGMNMDEEDTGTINTHYYLNNSDRLLGMYMDMKLQSNDLQFGVGISMKSSNFGRPVWQVTPSEDNIHDIDPELFNH